MLLLGVASWRFSLVLVLRWCLMLALGVGACGLSLGACCWSLVMMLSA
jgi:hypothetical protein